MDDTGVGAEVGELLGGATSDELVDGDGDVPLREPEGRPVGAVPGAPTWEPHPASAQSMASPPRTACLRRLRMPASETLGDPSVGVDVPRIISTEAASGPAFAEIAESSHDDSA